MLGTWRSFGWSRVTTRMGDGLKYLGYVTVKLIKPFLLFCLPTLLASVDTLFSLLSYNWAGLKSSSRVTNPRSRVLKTYNPSSDPYLGFPNLPHFSVKYN